MTSRKIIVGLLHLLLLGVGCLEGWIYNYKLGSTVPSVELDWRVEEPLRESLILASVIFTAEGAVFVIHKHIDA